MQLPIQASEIVKICLTTFLSISSGLGVELGRLRDLFHMRISGSERALNWEERERCKCAFDHLCLGGHAEDETLRYTNLFLYLSTLSLGVWFWGRGRGRVLVVLYRSYHFLRD